MGAGLANKTLLVDEEDCRPEGRDKIGTLVGDEARSLPLVEDGIWIDEGIGDLVPDLKLTTGVRNRFGVLNGGKAGRGDNDLRTLRSVFNGVGAGRCHRPDVGDAICSTI